MINKILHYKHLLSLIVLILPLALLVSSASNSSRKFLTKSRADTITPVPSPILGGIVIQPPTDTEMQLINNFNSLIALTPITGNGFTLSYFQPLDKIKVTLMPGFTAITARANAIAWLKSHGYGNMPSSFFIYAYTVSPTPTPTLAPTPFNLKVQEDATVKSNNPTTNFGSSTYLQVDNSPDIYRVYLKFDLSSVAGKSVTQAILRLKTSSVSNASSTSLVKISPLSNPSASWSEATITYSNKPSVSTAVIASFVPSALSTTYSADVTSAVVSRLGSMLTLVLTMSGSDGADFISKEGGTVPILQLSFSTTPPSPSPRLSITPTLRPSPLPNVSITPTLRPLVSITPTRLPPSPTPAPISQVIPACDSRFTRSGTVTCQTSASANYAQLLTGGSLTTTQVARSITVDYWDFDSGQPLVIYIDNQQIVNLPTNISNCGPSGCRKTWVSAPLNLAPHTLVLKGSGSGYGTQVIQAFFNVDSSPLPPSEWVNLCDLRFATTPTANRVVEGTPCYLQLLSGGSATFSRYAQKIQIQYWDFAGGQLLQIYIDGSLYSALSTDLYNCGGYGCEKVWTSPLLSPGVHTLRIVGPGSGWGTQVIQAYFSSTP